jgi:hypothetical protein
MQLMRGQRVAAVGEAGVESGRAAAAVEAAKAASSQAKMASEVGLLAVTAGNRACRTLRMLGARDATAFHPLQRFSAVLAATAAAESTRAAVATSRYP